MVDKKFIGLDKPDITRFESYLPTAFSSELTLLQKVNKIIQDLNRSFDLNNEMVEYLNRFIESFDDKLYETLEDVLEVWLNDDRLAIIIGQIGLNLETFKTAVNQRISLLEQKDVAFEQQIQENKTKIGETQTVVSGHGTDIGTLKTGVNNNRNNLVNTDLKLKETSDEVVQGRNKFPSLLAHFNSLQGEVTGVKGYVDGRLSGLGNMSPKEVFQTVSALTTKYPNGANGIYLVVENGNSYYYDGAWKVFSKYMTTELPNSVHDYPIINFYGGTYREKFADFDVLNNVIRFPKGTVIINNYTYDFEAQEMVISDAQKTPQMMLIFNLNTRKFRPEWRSTQASLSEYDVQCGLYSYPSRNYNFNFPMVVTNANFLANTNTNTLKPVILQHTLINVKTTVLNGVATSVFTIPSDLEIYFGNDWFPVKEQVITYVYPSNTNTVFLYFNILTEKFDLYSYDDVLGRNIKNGGVMIDVYKYTKPKNNVLKYEADSPKTMLDNLDYSLPPYLSSGYAKLLSKFKRDRLLDNKIIICLTTDTHVEGSNTRYSNIENIVQLSHYFKTDYLLHLGDIVQGASSPDDMLNKLTSVVTRMNQGSGKTFMIHGNHDNNFTGQNGLVNESQLKNIVGRNNLSNMTSYHDSGAYEVSDTTNKITLFFLNSFDFPDTVIGSNDALRYGYGASQLTWLQSRLSSVPINHKVLFFSHNGFSGSTTIGDSDTVIRNQGALRKLIESFNQSTNVPITQTNISNNHEYYNISLNTTFATKPTNRIIACFSGHWHWDKNQTVNGVKHYSLISSLIDPTYNNVTKTTNDVTSDSIKLLLIDKTSFETRIIGYGGNLFENQLV